MRLSPVDRATIVRLTAEVVGERAVVRLFGSRVHDELKGGDIDLMVSLSDPISNPAVLAARLAARIERALGGRRVDVVLHAPNLLEQPIHRAAMAEGQLL